MIKILALLPSPDDGTSWYRGAGPLNALRDKIHCDIINAQQEISWSIIGNYDIIFFQRPFDKLHVNTAITAFNMGRKVWVDYDDLLFEIPKDSLAYDMYMREEVHNNMTFFLNHANAITFSTEHLKKCMMERQFKIPSDQIVEVIPNAFDDINLKIQPFARENNVVWRGSGTHQRDMLINKDAIISAIKSSDVPSHFIGYNPFFITEELKKVSLHQWSGSVIKYMMHLMKGNKGSGWGQTFFVSLHDSDFNRAKSNINWIESIMSGACCVAPAWDEWTDCLRYGDMGDDYFINIGDAIKAALENETRRRKSYEWGVQKIMDTLRLTEINKQRLIIFDKMVS